MRDPYLYPGTRLRRLSNKNILDQYIISTLHLHHTPTFLSFLDTKYNII